MMMAYVAILCLCLVHLCVVSSRCCSPPPTTPKPSRAPTHSPSRLPSTEPTRRPSRAPTPSPTRLPSIIPSRKPSRNPTPEPSTSPSEEPTYAPSQPTSQPSSTPTTFTPRPTYQPSIAPSYQPSVEPTTKPSVFPTKVPSLRPSNVPSLSPSVIPSTEPTEYPTISMRPTITPSVVPSIVPTLTPTEDPSTTPSVAPSVRPSTAPTFNPTTTVAFSLRMQISQVLVNIDAATFQNSSANFDAFNLAVSSTVDLFESTDVNIITVTDTALRLRRYLRESTLSTHMSAAVPEVNVEYAVSFVVQERGFANGAQASEYVKSRLRAAVDDGTFAANLASAAANVSGADPALRNVTAGALTFLTSDITILRSAEPTTQPTTTPGAAVGGATKSGFAGLGAGAQAGIIIAILLGTAILFFLLYLALRRVECAATMMSKGAVLWYEMVRPRGHEKNPYRGEKKMVSTGANHQTEATVDSKILIPGSALPSKVPTNLLFLSRHAAATETLMEEIDSLFARLPPQENCSSIENTDSHPLTAGLDVRALPPVVFPEVRDLASLLKAPDPPKLLFIGRNCPATQRALWQIDYSLNMANGTLDNEFLKQEPGEEGQQHARIRGNASGEEKEEEGKEVLHFNEVTLYPPPPPFPGTQLAATDSEISSGADGAFGYVDALSMMILNRNLETAALATRDAPSPPPPPPSTSPSTVRTEFTEYSESSAMFADCLEGPPLRVLSAAAVATYSERETARNEILPQSDIIDVKANVGSTVAESVSIKLPEPDADLFHDAGGQVRIVNSRRPRSPRSPTLLTTKGGNSAFVRPKAL